MSEEDRIRNLMMLDYSQLIMYASSLEELDDINHKEIERLKELCDKYEEEHKTTFEEWKKTINIINELEKYIIDFKEDYEKNRFQPNAKVYIYWKDLIDKLQELKGSESNE